LNDPAREEFRVPAASVEWKLALFWVAETEGGANV
jgi:hypothetical protein